MAKQFINLGTSFELGVSAGVEASLSCSSKTVISLAMQSSYGAFAGREFSTCGATVSYTVKDVKLVSQTSRNCEGFSAIGLKSLRAAAKNIFFGSHGTKINAELGDLLLFSQISANVRMKAGAATLMSASGRPPVGSDIINISSLGTCMFSINEPTPGESIKLTSAALVTLSSVCVDSTSVTFGLPRTSVDLNAASVSMVYKAVKMEPAKVTYFLIHERLPDLARYFNGSVQSAENRVQILSASIG